MSRDHFLSTRPTPEVNTACMRKFSIRDSRLSGALLPWIESLAQQGTEENQPPHEFEKAGSMSVLLVAIGCEDERRMRIRRHKECARVDLNELRRSFLAANGRRFLTTRWSGKTSAQAIVHHKAGSALQVSKGGQRRRRGTKDARVRLVSCVFSDVNDSD